MESNAWAMLRCWLAILVLNDVVIGLAGGPAGAGCWAARPIGAARAMMAKSDRLIRNLYGQTKDHYSDRGVRFPQLSTIPLQTFGRAG